MRLLKYGAFILMWYNIYMKTVFSSASKLAFLILTLALCIFTYKGIVDPKDFIVLIGMAYTYYFVKKDTPQPVDSQLG